MTFGAYGDYSCVARQFLRHSCHGFEGLYRRSYWVYSSDPTLKDLQAPKFKHRDHLVWDGCYKWCEPEQTRTYVDTLARTQDVQNAFVCLILCERAVCKVMPQLSMFPLGSTLNCYHCYQWPIKPPRWPDCVVLSLEALVRPLYPIQAEKARRSLKSQAESFGSSALISLVSHSKRCDQLLLHRASLMHHYWWSWSIRIGICQCLLQKKSLSHHPLFVDTTARTADASSATATAS